MTDKNKKIHQKQKNDEAFDKKTELEEKIIQIDRVARVVAGGRRFRFRAAVVVGNRQGRIGIGIAKGSDVSTAITKASSYARKHMIDLPFQGHTIPYQIEESFGSAHILLKPASPGTGIIAGGAVRPVLETAGIHDILSKILGSANKINNIQATFRALQKLKDLETKNKMRKANKINTKKTKDKTKVKG